MMFLVISACLMDDINACNVYRISLPEQTERLTCTLSAQPYLVKWAEHNPVLRIKKWTCEFPEIATI
jgi:hypothetical protein